MGRGEETFLKKGFLSPPTDPLLSPSQDFRLVGRPRNGVQKYIHAATKREFDVPQKNLDEDLILKIQNQLGAIII